MKITRVVGGTRAALALAMSLLLLAGCTPAAPTPPPTTPCPVQCEESYSACKAGCPAHPLGGDPCIPNCADAYGACMLHCTGPATP